MARVEVLPFASTILADQEFLAGRKEGKPVVVAGELRIPTVDEALLRASWTGAAVRTGAAC